MNEHRRAPRHRVFKAGKVLFNRHFSAVDCVVRNVSSTGACLELESSISLPDEFELSILKDNVVRACRVAWRRLDRVGVTFVQTPGVT
jgi:hypothetical protein